MSILSDKEIGALRDAKNARDVWLPPRGYYEVAETLRKFGLLADAGIAAMPPHKLYVITDAGRAAISPTQPKGT